MTREHDQPGYQLPTYPDRNCGRETEGFFTPTVDMLPQIFSIPPKRVLPIIFLPGIMGTNLRMSAERQARLRKRNNIAWRPENKMASIALAKANAKTRQLQLDPKCTEVDTYDPVRNPTGDPDETSDERHDNVVWDGYGHLNVGIDTPLLLDDPQTAKPRRMKVQKVRQRGWGEIYFDSYRELLEMCEHRLNAAFRDGAMDPWWERIVGVDPSKWQAAPSPKLQPLKEEALKDAVEDCWFPVHAIGYNWLKSNRDSAGAVATRINSLIEQYQDQGFQCEKVIVVTHSMGGLVARALIHPNIGNLHDKVLGVVHGVMPAIGAAATYKRMRCGFEDSIFSVAPKVLGNHGNEVTAVLANAQGGLELLPSQAYGNAWLHVVRDGQKVLSLPRNGDPYEEIYKVQGKWYGLLREDWINPAQLKKSGFSTTCTMLDKAKKFHNDIVDTYHDHCYAHYGASQSRAAWHHVAWQIERNEQRVAEMLEMHIVGDDMQGELSLSAVEEASPPHGVQGMIDSLLPGSGRTEGNIFKATMEPARDPGDQTVPLHSADHQMRSGKFKGLFRQTGYEHQASYSDENALDSTIYSLVRIAQTMKWSK